MIIEGLDSRTEEIRKLSSLLRRNITGRQRLLIKRGLKATATGIRVEKDSAIVQKIKQAGAEAVIYGGYHPEAASIISQMRKKGMKTLFISDDGVKDVTFIKVAGKYAEGVYATGPKDTSKNPLAIAANEDHKKAYGSDPGAFYLNAYAATQAILNAIQKAKSTDYAKVSNALRTSPVDTPLGKIKFDRRGDAIGVGFAMYQVKNGIYVEVK
jgi:branched-chain amino acid transport system substrate-binding protein